MIWISLSRDTAAIRWSRDWCANLLIRAIQTCDSCTLYRYASRLFNLTAVKAEPVWPCMLSSDCRCAVSNETCVILAVGKGNRGSSDDWTGCGAGSEGWVVVSGTVNTGARERSGQLSSILRVYLSGDDGPVLFQLHTCSLLMVSQHLPPLLSLLVSLSVSLSLSVYASLCLSVCLAVCVSRSASHRPLPSSQSMCV